MYILHQFQLKMNQQPDLQFGEVDRNLIMNDMEVDREIANLAINNENGM